MNGSNYTMFNFKNLILSPAMPAAILLYGIIFGFAIWSYLGLQWLRIDTITLYVSIAVWSGVVISRRWRPSVFSLNLLDILFGVFLLWVLGSVATHWWKGTIQYLEFMPFFVVLPYLLGRLMVIQDRQFFQKILIGMASILLLLLPFEYWKNSRPGFLYENSSVPILFGQGHGVMLTGLLFSAAFLALISRLLSPPEINVEPTNHARGYKFLGYLMVGALVTAMVWISSRGSVVGLALAMIALLLFSSFYGWKKKLGLLFYIGLIALVALTFSFQNKYHKEYYQQVFEPPAVALKQVPNQVPRLEYGKPILGTQVCKAIPNSISDRWIHYRTAWEIFRAKPWTGVGANAYGFYSCTGPGWYPHTSVLQVLAELGVLGGLSYFLLIGLIFCVPIMRYKSTTEIIFRSNMGWLLAFIVLQFTTSQFNGNYFMSAGLYFVMGLAASLVATNQQRMETKLCAS